MKGWIRIVVGVVALALAAATALVAWSWRNPMTLFTWASRRALERAGFERITVATADGAMTCFEGGSGPPLILLHGAGDQAGTWSAVAPRFADRYRVIAVDLPGHGDSDPRSGPLTLTAIVAGVEALLDGLPEGERAVLVGNSLGAWVAAVLAARRPERIERIVLVDGGPLRWVSSGPTLTPRDREEARALVAAIRDPDSPPLPDNVLDDLVEWTARGAVPRLLAAGADLEGHLMDDALDRIAVPADVVWGESDRLIPMDYARRLTAGLPTARLTTLPKCGHVPQIECPAEFVETLATVLAGPTGEPR